MTHKLMQRIAAKFLHKYYD